MKHPIEHEPDSKLVVKLYAHDISVYSESCFSENMITNPRKNTPPLHLLEPVEQYLLCLTIEQISNWDLDNFKDMRFPIGGMGANGFTDITDQTEYVTKLLWGYPHADRIVSQFGLAQATSASLDSLAGAMQRLNADMAFTTDDAKKDLLRILAKDLSEIDEPISYGRVMLLRPYLVKLARKDEAMRRTTIQYMLERQGEYTETARRGTDGQDGWMLELD